MIQCHTFNSLTRPDLRHHSVYVMSQFIGGMAAPLFLFMAGMTLAFQMESLERRMPSRRDRWLGALKRGGYVLGIAFLFRLSNGLPSLDFTEILKVDVLNCMGVAMIVLSAAAVFGARGRTRFGLAAGLGIAAAAPIVANLPWEGHPVLLRQYLAAEPGVGRFAFFPCAAYVAFGLAAGTLVKTTDSERFERMMQWVVLAGLALVVIGQYFANMPYTLYTHSDFWADSPVLILIRAGISLLILSGGYLWTQYGAGAGWSWLQTLGRNSLMVYWVHVVLVYGDTLKRLKQSSTIVETLAATLIVTLLMLVLSLGWMRWKARRAQTAANASPARRSPSANISELTPIPTRK